MRASLLLLVGLTACGSGAVRARWLGATGPSSLTAVGTAGWCPETRTIVVEATDQDEAVGVMWHYGETGPATGALELSAPSDSVAAPAAAVLRYVHLDEVRGYRSAAGTLTITAADTQAVSGTVTALMQHVGDADSTRLDLTFRAVPMHRDATVCVNLPSPRDTTAIAPTAADTAAAVRDTL